MKVQLKQLEVRKKSEGLERTYMGHSTNFVVKNEQQNEDTGECDMTSKKGNFKVSNIKVCLNANENVPISTSIGNTGKSG
jgi:hypothetical protein